MFVHGQYGQTTTRSTIHRPRAMHITNVGLMLRKPVVSIRSETDMDNNTGQTPRPCSYRQTNVLAIELVLHTMIPTG